MTSPAEATPEPSSATSPPGRRWPSNAQGLAIALLLVLSPALAALAWFPGFISQDGPAHLYNAQIIAGSIQPSSPFRDVFAVRWQPLPNWAGHLLYLIDGLILPPSQAERLTLGVTLLGLACATAWLRQRVSPSSGVFTTAAVAALLGMNVTWLFGFTGFALGAALFGLTLALWWDGRENLTWGRLVGLSVLLVLGYFCHPVSLGLTVFGLIVLAIGERGNRRTMLRTALALLPLIPLVLIYRGLTKAGGPMRPEWGHLANVFSLRDWATQLGWADPISLAAKLYRPFGPDRSSLNLPAAPILWFVAGLAILSVVTLRSGRGSAGRKSWGILAAILLVAGLVGPDTLGTSHGHYLPQRIVLLGLVALVPWLKFDAPGRWATAARACIWVAFGLQSLFIWDYGHESNRTAGPYLKLAQDLGRNKRVAALLLGYHGRFRVNPMLHADCLLGVGTDHIIWGDYETTHYYFPVQLLNPDTSPNARALEGITRLDGEANAHFRREIWSDYLDRYHDQIDIVLIWGNDPEVEAITTRYYSREGIGSDGKTQIWVSRASHK